MIPPKVTKADQDRAEKLVNLNHITHDGLVKAYKELAASWYALERRILELEKQV